MGFSQGLSGLNASSQALDVVGNNIANSQTVGFKSGSVAFADVFAGSQVGMGVQVAGVNQNFSDGVLGAGSSALDMGIQGNGFFRMVTEAGRVFYSRNGQFQTDESGYVVNNQGMRLTGYMATGTPPAIQQGAPVGAIQIPTGQMPARASDAGSISGVHHAELRLHPEELGALQVSLRVNNDQAQVHFVSESHHVRAALESAMPNLRTMLEESGISLGQSSVGADTSSSAGDAHSGHTSGQGKSESGQGDLSVSSEEESPVVTRVMHYSRGINTFA